MCLLCSTWHSCCLRGMTETARIPVLHVVDIIARVLVVKASLACIIGLTQHEPKMTEVVNAISVYRDWNSGLMSCARRCRQH